jgi:hypothetical protein
MAFVTGTARIHHMADRPGPEPSRIVRWGVRTASWLPTAGLFAIFAALRFEAADGVITALLVVTFAALVIDVIVFCLARSGGVQHR